MLSKHLIFLLHKYAQLTDPELMSPEIKIEPVDSLIQEAVKLLKQKDASFFVGVRKIVVDTGSGYGHVSSGRNEDPAVIHINLSKIKSDLQTKMQGAAPDVLKKELVRQIAIIIAHEKAHVKSYKPEAGFVGGESVAEQAEREMAGKLK